MAWENNESVSLEKHTTSPVYAADEMSKHGKHHHSRSHHHHRHRSRKHRQSKRKHGKEEAGDDKCPFLPATTDFRVDDDKEEGEILDDDRDFDEKLKKLKADSEIESGEIKPDDAADETSAMKIDESSVIQVLPIEGDTLSGTWQKKLDLDRPLACSCEQSARNFNISKDGGDDGNEERQSLAIDMRDETSDQLRDSFDRMVTIPGNSELGVNDTDCVGDKKSQFAPQHNNSKNSQTVIENSGDEVDASTELRNGYLVSNDKEYTLGECDVEIQLLIDSEVGDHLHDKLLHVGESLDGIPKVNDALRSHGRASHQESSKNEDSFRKMDDHARNGNSKSSKSKEKVRLSPEVDDRHKMQEKLFPGDRSLTHANGEIDRRLDKGDSLHRHMDSHSPSRGVRKERNYADADSGIGISSGELRRHVRSRSPFVSESLNSKRPRKRDDQDADHSLGRYDTRSSDSADANRDSYANRNRPLLPESLRDSHKTKDWSLSHDKCHDEVRGRKRLRSCDRERERISLSQNSLHYKDFLQTVHSPERDAKFSKHSDGRIRLPDSRDNGKSGADRDRIGRHHRVDDWEDDSRDWGRSMDRERPRDNTVRKNREHSSSYSRHGGEDARDVRDRYRNRVGDRDIRTDRDKEDQRDSRDRAKSEDRERLRDTVISRHRERSSSYSRRWEEDMHDGRDRGMDRDKERDKDRLRDRDRDKDKTAVSRHHKYDNHNFSRHGRDRLRGSRHWRYGEPEYERDRPRKKESARDPSFTRLNMEEGNDATRVEDEQENYQERVALQLAEQEEDVDKIKEESRKRRQAILEKYKQQSQLQVESAPQVDCRDEKEPVIQDKSADLSSEKPTVHPINQVLAECSKNKHDSSDVYVADPSFSVGKSPLQNGTIAFDRESGAGGLGDGSPKSERSEDMFCDDMFGESPAGVRKLGKGNGLHVERSGLHDNWDDAEGYYSYRFGEVLDGRYEVTAAHGKGVFSTVVRAKDLKAGKGDPEEVAVKIIRNNDTMYKAGLEELIILKKLAGADPDDKRHCVRFLSSFKYRNHLCLVFESLHMNLREILKKFGRNIGLKLTAVRAYAKQLFIALKHLRNCGVLHCDIKPDNMLVNEAKNVLKLCDLGNAMFAGKNELTPYLVSRFYRAPEIILGLPYDHPMDIWSVGCCLYELYLGKVLFPGPSNNDMLRLHMELKGPFPKKMLRKGAFTVQHFDHDLNFYATEEDSVTKKTVKRLLVNIRPKDIGSLISSCPGEDPKMLANFKDLLERIFVLDPEKRMTVSQALSHPFITGK